MKAGHRYIFSALENIQVYYEMNIMHNSFFHIFFCVKQNIMQIYHH